MLESCLIRLRGLFALGALLLLGACAGVEPQVLPLASSEPEAAASGFEVEIRAADKARVRVPEDPTGALRAELERLEEARRWAGTDPAQRRLVLRRLAKAELELAILTEEREGGDGARSMYERALNHAYEDLRLNAAFAAACDADGGRVNEAAIAALEAVDAPAALLGASAWGGASRLKGPFSLLKDRGRILGLARRALELDPDGLAGGPNRFFGAYYALLPGFLGGDLERSRGHFEAALATDRTYLWNRVMRAENYVLRSGRKDEAVSELRAVLRTPPGEDPLREADQWLARFHARGVLERVLGDAGASETPAAATVQEPGR